MARVAWVDCVKGFAIMLVVLGHIVEISPFKIWFYGFHVPIFFMCSGYLQKEHGSLFTGMADVLSWIKKKLLKLVAPYFVFEFIYAVVYTCMTDGTWSTLKWNIIDIITLHSRADANWFIICYLISEFVYIFIESLIRNRYLKSTILVLIFLTPFFVSSNNYYCLVLLRCCLAIGFLAVGKYFVPVILQLKWKKYVAMLGILVSVIMAEINGLTGMYSLTFHNSAIYILNAILSSFVIIYIFKSLRCARIPLLTFFGRDSLLVLGLHGSVLLLLKNILSEQVFIQQYFKWLIVLLIMGGVIVLKKYIDSIFVRIRKNNRFILS